MDLDERRDEDQQLFVAYYEPLRAHIARRIPPVQGVHVSAEDVAQEALQAFIQIGLTP